jgi:hypothetical protein
MGLIKEPKEADLSMKSKPWTEEDLYDFRKLMKKITMKNKNNKDKSENQVSKK